VTTASSKFDVNRTSSNMCGVTLMNNQNGYVVAEVMRGKQDVTVSEYPSMIRVDGKNKIIFNWDEISEAIGFEFSQPDFEEIMSTHYGRMVHLDDQTIMFANPEDAAEYIDFDLKPVS
jgi:propane monooxygenase coupling protein